MAKELKWRGLSEEDVKNLDMSKFLELIPARRRRSLKRGYTEDQKALLKKIEKNEQNLKTHSRDMVIIPVMLGKSIMVYNGKDYVPVIVTVEMLGHCLGEYSHTRKSVSHSSAGVGATRSSKAVSAR
ncbi:MAG: 30S ribosomal protein S19 [archaeon]